MKCQNAPQGLEIGKEMIKLKLGLCRAEKFKKEDWIWMKNMDKKVAIIMKYLNIVEASDNLGNNNLFSKKQPIGHQLPREPKQLVGNKIEDEDMLLDRRFPSSSDSTLLRRSQQFAMSEEEKMICGYHQAQSTNMSINLPTKATLVVGNLNQVLGREVDKKLNVSDVKHTSELLVTASTSDTELQMKPSLQLIE